MQVLNTLKSKIMSPWSLMRVLRLFLGCAVIFQAYSAGQWIMVLVGIGFTALPLLNVGCGCSGNNCEL